MVGELERLDNATVVVGAISILAGVAGVIGTRAWIRRPTTTDGNNSYLFWSLGILAVLPAWAGLVRLPDPIGPRRTDTCHRRRTMAVLDHARPHGRDHERGSAAPLSALARGPFAGSSMVAWAVGDDACLGRDAASPVYS
jgi:hypothetical protein